MSKLSPVACLAILQCIAASEARTTYAQDIAVRDRAREVAPTQVHQQTWQATRDRLVTSLRISGKGRDTDEAIDCLKAATTKREFEAALEPLTLIQVSINPESRVKIKSLRPRISLLT